jgi:hypothetical protein
MSSWMFIYRNELLISYRFPKSIIQINEDINLDFSLESHLLQKINTISPSDVIIFKVVQPVGDIFFSNIA